MAAPYGYTLVIWSTGMLSVSQWGPLRPAQAAAYVAGALASTVALTTLAWGALETNAQPPARRSPAGSTIHWLSVPVAFGCAWVLTHLRVAPLVGTFLAAFVATLAYQILVSLERYLLGGREC